VEIRSIGEEQSMSNSTSYEESTSDAILRLRMSLEDAPSLSSSQKGEGMLMHAG
jgi:hypothetical protein